MNESDMKHHHYILEVFQYYYTPILVHLGALGNALSVYVIFRTKLRKLSSSYYLVALSISDTIFLITIFILWLQMNGINIFNKPIVCPLMIYLSGVVGCMSVWVVMAFTAERFVAVMYPLKSKFMCTVSRAKIIIFTLLSIAMIVYSPQLLFADVIDHPVTNKSVCDVKAEWQREAHIFNIFDFIATFVVPMSVITVLNACIIKNIWKFSEVRRKLTNTKLEGNAARSRKSKNKSSQNLTKMLVIVSTVSVVMNLPSYICRILAYLIAADVLGVPASMIDSFILFQQLSQILFYTTFGINFALYCISGQNFRRSVATVFRMCNNDRPSENSPMPDNKTQSTGSTGSKKRRTPTRWVEEVL
ncbi:PREDICTED: FMRFamide receptor [Nicrophorus vespilloides]|uniref:FMRFamide receptor n=1 Tax=Nicrophorus vespilloides TaxID=110193 RepID=A0ABM1MZW5_NICVS|nr:PREDICTED: FMRFamide receptor [Nicrophorus vespilloides]